MSVAETSLLLRTLHATANGLHWLGVNRHRLVADDLVAEAKKKTKLSDVGPEPWSEAFQQLVSAYDQDPLLSPLGRAAVRAALTGVIVHRLHIIAEVKADPGLRDQPIKRPVFVLGFPRTGTTWLYQLLT